jgi:2-methylcitrate dehydratase PrpD
MNDQNLEWEVRLAIDYALGHNHLVHLTGTQLDAAAKAAVARMKYLQSTEAVNG